MTPRADARGVPAPHGLPADTRIGTVRLAVADLERSVTYYEDVIGLRALTGAACGPILLAPQGDDRALIELHESPGAAPVPRSGRVGLYHFAILVPDRPTLGIFAAHLADVGIRPGAADHRVSEALYLSDPDGLGIEVYADRPRRAWTYRGSEVEMASDPLDLGELAGAGGGPWAGLPAGTVMGHLHLHVRDLDAAAAFYHRALGLDLTTWSYPQALFLSAGGYHHHLGVNTWSSGAAAGPGDARLLEWELVLPSTHESDALAEALGAAGHTVDRSSEGSAVGFTVADPWGTVVRLVGGVRAGTIARRAS